MNYLESRRQQLISSLRDLEIEIENERVEIQRIENERNNATDKLVEYINMDDTKEQNERKIIKNVIITSPTQLGKTKYIIDACKLVESGKNLIIISCDNSLAQLSQLGNRLKNSHVIFFNLRKAKINEISEIINSGRSVVLTMINNQYDITKLQKLIFGIQTKCVVNKYVFFHDEADTLNKADEIDDISNSSLAISHRKWVQTMNMMENFSIRRFWVSATPENCSNISKITCKDIIVLPNDVKYRKITNHVSWNGENDNDIGIELSRISSSGSGEIILYCVDVKNSVQLEKARSLSSKFKCYSASHNMSGTKVFFDGGFHKYFDKSISISDIISQMAPICVRDQAPLLIVGFSLMTRGISFVGKEIENPQSATTMFVKTGKKSHVVGLAQRFGRICGTSRPDISRRIVYCSDEMYSDYNGYISNQNIVWDALNSTENSNKSITDVLAESDGVFNINRPLDRPKLNGVNSLYSSSCSSDSRGDSGVTVEYDTSKMKRLVNSWKNTTNSTAIARVFREIITRNGKMESNLVRDIIGDNAYDALTSTSHNNYKLIFTKDSEYHYIKQEALDYYNTL